MTKYVQKNKGVMVRLSKDSHTALEQMMSDRRWSKAACLAYITEQYFHLTKDPIQRKCR